jgi:Ca2+-binding EF-hand superfamily protein
MGAAGSPQQHAVRAIEKFDKNGDGKLDAGELVALLTAIRERLGQHQGQGHTPPATTAPATPTST